MKKGSDPLYRVLKGSDPFFNGLLGAVPALGFRFTHLGGFAMGLVMKKVVAIAAKQFRIPLYNQEVFRVFPFGLVGEVETAGNQRLLVDNHDFVVGDGVVGIDEWAEALFEKDVHVGIFFDLIAAVEEDFYFDAPLFGVNQTVG